MSLEAMQEFEAREHFSSDATVTKAAKNVAHVLSIELMTRPYRGASVPKILDFGCGYGEFLAMCSLFGFQTLVSIDLKGEGRMRASRYFHQSMMLPVSRRFSRPDAV